MLRSGEDEPQPCTGGTTDKKRKPQMSEEGELTGGDGREGEGNKLEHRMDLHKDIKVNYYAENRREGGGRRGWGLGRAN